MNRAVIATLGLLGRVSGKSLAPLGLGDLGDGHEEWSANHDPVAKCTFAHQEFTRSEFA